MVINSVLKWVLDFQITDFKVVFLDLWQHLQDCELANKNIYLPVQFAIQINKESFYSINIPFVNMKLTWLDNCIFSGNTNYLSVSFKE